ncbi:MAG: sialate O-acetylesterase, partial [Planctomycetota bacterium]
QEDHYGPEIGFADAYLDLVPDGELVLIKFSDGGTSMARHWAPPGTQGDLPNGGPVYINFYNELDLAFAELDARGYEYTVEGAIWMQGESDSGHGWRADLHDDQLPVFISDLRTYVGNPEMPYIIGRIANNNLGYDEIVRDTQVMIANTDPYACWVDTDDLTKLDLYHYDEASTLLLGERFAKALRRLTTPRGDANLDGQVDVEDVYQWNQNPSDENCDGVIDSADLGVVMTAVRGE